MTSIEDRVRPGARHARAGWPAAGQPDPWGPEPTVPPAAWPGPLPTASADGAEDVEPVPGSRSQPHAPEGADLSRARRRVARIALWARNLGALLLLFVAYQLWGTGFEQARSQVVLQHSFDAVQPTGRQLAFADGPVGPSGPVPGRDDAVARIEIPAIGVDQIVVEGTGVEDLKKGPGHYVGSPLPGQPGNAAIAGHRTTYGAPFNRVDELGPGDQIITTTRQGRFLYIVAGKPVAQSPHNIKAVNEQGDDRLTLTTCHPKYSAAQRLIVVAKLRKGDGTPAAPTPASPVPGAGRPAARAGLAAVADPGAGWHVDALPASVMLGAVLLWLCVFSGRLQLVWARLSVWVVVTPIGLCLLLLLFEHLNRLLPSNV